MAVGVARGVTTAVLCGARRVGAGRRPCSGLLGKAVSAGELPLKETQ